MFETSPLKAELLLGFSFVKKQTLKIATLFVVNKSTTQILLT